MKAFTGGGGERASSVFQVIYDTASDAIAARFQGAWDYSADFSDAFVMRFEFFGSPATHEFTLRATKWNSKAEGYYSQMVGKGVSQGAGAHFLFQVKDNNSTGSHNVLSAPKYFCYDAGTGVAAEVTDDITGSACAGYEDDVKAITGLEHADMPDDVFSTTVTTE